MEFRRFLYLDPHLSMDGRTFSEAWQATPEAAALGDFQLDANGSGELGMRLTFEPGANAEVPLKTLWDSIQVVYHRHKQDPEEEAELHYSIWYQGHAETLTLRPKPR